MAASIAGITLSLFVSVTANVGDDPNIYQEQVWVSPLVSDVKSCAHMARSLNESFAVLQALGKNDDWVKKEASCDAYPTDDDDDDDNGGATALAHHTKFTF